jgi:DNA-binding NarL/FixJ family response regulator
LVMPTRAEVKTTPRRIFLVEDHPTFREGITQILEKEEDLTICGAAGTAMEALKAVLRLQPDLVLVDITLPGKSGLELIKELRKTDSKVKLLVLSMHDEALYANRVLRAGGDGYIMKQEDPEEIIHAIRDVLSGHVYVSEDVFATSAKTGRNRGGDKTTLAGFEELGDTELEVLAMLGRGKTSGEIARHFHVPLQQIDARCKQMGRKLKLKNANELIRYAVCWVETGAT